MDSSSPIYQRAPVIGHSLWVTAYDDNERWPAGNYPTQSHQDTGITRWIVEDAPLIGTDLVLVVRLWNPSHHLGRGLADHAGRHQLVLAQAVWLLRWIRGLIFRHQSAAVLATIIVLSNLAGVCFFRSETITHESAHAMRPPERLVS